MSVDFWSERVVLKLILMNWTLQNYIESFPEQRPFNISSVFFEFKQIVFKFWKKLMKPSII